MKRKQIYIILSIAVQIFTSLQTTAKVPSRHPLVQARVNEVFDKLQNRGSKWLYDGTDTIGISPMGLSDERLIDRVIKKSGDKNAIYLMELGAGYGFGWGRGMSKYLLENYKDHSKEFHVISLTGDMAPKYEKKIASNVTTHNFSGFKLEDLDKELPRFGLELENSVDLIVSRWTLRHLADPYGTLERAYDLLVPGKGIYAGDGFFVKFAYEYDAPYNNINQLLKLMTLFRASNARYFTRWDDGGKALHQFLLERPDEKPLTNPAKVRHTGSIFFINKLAQCYSRSGAELELLNGTVELSSTFPRFIFTYDDSFIGIFFYFGQKEIFEQFLIEDNLKENWPDSSPVKNPSYKVVYSRDEL